MDPDANLKEQREIIARMQQARNEPRVNAADAERLAELAQALDEWIVRGGSLPAAWQREGAYRAR